MLFEQRLKQMKRFGVLMGRDRGCGCTASRGIVFRWRRPRQENGYHEEKKKTLAIHPEEPANRFALRPSITQTLGRSAMPH